VSSHSRLGFWDTSNTSIREVKMDHRKGAAVVTLAAGALLFLVLNALQQYAMAIGDLSWAPYILFSLALVLVGGFYAHRLLGPGGRFAAMLLRWLVAAPLMFYFAIHIQISIRTAFWGGKRMPPLVTDPIELDRMFRARIGWYFVWFIGLLIALWPEITWLARKVGAFRRPTPPPGSGDTDSGLTQKNP
jgi:hypothetical protein